MIDDKIPRRINPKGIGLIYIYIWRERDRERERERERMFTWICRLYAFEVLSLGLREYMPPILSPKPLILNPISPNP